MPYVMSQVDSPPLRDRKLRWLRRESFMREYAERAFKSQLRDGWEFDFFYESLDDVDKDAFLGLASRYLFLVKDGDWHITEEGSCSVTDYFTNSFKLVALFSLIESLSTEPHQDFYEWLVKEGASIYPIQSRRDLESLYERYKLTHGGIRRCVAFFERLTDQRQEELRGSIRLSGAPAESVKRVAQFLYNLRSKFVHECELVLDIASHPVLSKHKRKSKLINLSIPRLLYAFEEGVIEYFLNAK
jgi:hypothetical protein